MIIIFVVAVVVVESSIIIIIIVVVVNMFIMFLSRDLHWRRRRTRIFRDDASPLC
jgi:hypothetical protein